MNNTTSLSLGNPDTVELLLRSLADDIQKRIVDVRMGRIDLTTSLEIEAKAIAANAEIFLGRNEHYRAVADWNSVGKIDGKLARQFKLRDHDPHQRLCAVILWFVTKIYNAAWHSSTSEVDAAITEFTKILSPRSDHK